MKALFIHGLNSDKNSTTGKTVSNILKEYNIDVETYTYDILNVSDTLDKINSRLSKMDIDFVIGHSLGAFYTLMCYSGPVKIVINPCMFPSVEIPKLTDVNKNTINNFKKLEKKYKYVDFETIGMTYGIFSDNDSLFSYYDDFKSIYSYAMMIPGEHVFKNSDFLYYPFKHILSFFIDNKFNERIRTIFVQEHPYDAKEYVDEVFDILHDSYKEIGGVIGCNSPEELLKGSDLWKLGFKNKQLLAVVVYSTKTVGRKVKYLGAKKDSAGKVIPEAKEVLYQIIEEDLRKPGPQGSDTRKVWAEVSGGPENVYVKKFNAKIIDPNDVSIIKDEPITNIEKDGHYARRIGTDFHRKIAIASDKYSPIDDYNEIGNKQ